MELVILLAAVCCHGSWAAVCSTKVLYIEETEEGSERLVRRFGLLRLVHWLLSSFGLTGGQEVGVEASKP
jgi:hypothetical protein